VSRTHHNLAEMLLASIVRESLADMSKGKHLSTAVKGLRCSNAGQMSFRNSVENLADFRDRAGAEVTPIIVERRAACRSK